MWNAFTEVCIGLLLHLDSLLLQFLLSLFTFVLVCMVKCMGIPKLSHNHKYLLSFVSEFTCGLLRVNPYLCFRTITITVVPLHFCLIFCTKVQFCHCRSIIMMFTLYLMQYLLMY